MQKNTFGVALLSHKEISNKFDYSAKIKVAWIDKLLGNSEAFVDMIFHLNIPIEIIEKEECVNLQIHTPLDIEEGSLLCLYEQLKNWPFIIHEEKLKDINSIMEKGNDSLVASYFDNELIGLPEKSVLYAETDYFYFSKNANKGIFFGIQDIEVVSSSPKSFSVTIPTNDISYNLRKAKLLIGNGNIKHFPLYFSFRYKVSKSNVKSMVINTVLGRTVNFYFNLNRFLVNRKSIVRNNTIQPLSCQVSFLLTGHYVLLDSKGKWSETYKKEGYWEWHHIDDQIDAKMNSAYFDTYCMDYTSQYPYVKYINETSKLKWNKRLNKKRIEQTITYEYEFEAQKNKNWQTFGILFRAKRFIVIDKIWLVLKIAFLPLFLYAIFLCFNGWHFLFIFLLFSFLLWVFPAIKMLINDEN